MIKASEKNDDSFQVREKVAPNKHYETQRSFVKFFSTKRKSKRKRLKLCKPDAEEMKKISVNLGKFTPSICAVCLLVFFFFFFFFFKRTMAQEMKYLGNSVVPAAIGYM